MSTKKALNLADVAHRGIVIGLVGMTVFYTGLVVLRSHEIVERVQTAKATKRAQAQLAASGQAPEGSTGSPASGSSPR